MNVQPCQPQRLAKSLEAKVFLRLTAGLISIVTLLNQANAGQAAPNGINDYGDRMELLFIRTDLNNDGRLDEHELKGKVYLERILYRKHPSRYLILEDIRLTSPHSSGSRLQRRFNRADVDGNGKLDHHEAESIPWLAHNFKRLDFNEDNVITLEELWDLQRALAPRHHHQHHPPHHHKSPNHKRGHHYYDDRQNHLDQEN